MIETQTKSKRSVGRPRVETPKRGQTRYRKGQVVAGKEILAIRMRFTPAGQNRKAFSFRCDCGKRFETSEGVVTRAVRGSAQLRCKTCQDEAELVGNCKSPTVALPDPPTEKPELPKHRAIASVADLPELAATTRRLITKAAPDVLDRAKAMVAAHLRACLANRAPLESLDRLWVESLELAARNEPGDDWTPESIGQGLRVTRYEQYTQPSSVFWT